MISCRRFSDQGVGIGDVEEQAFPRECLFFFPHSPMADWYSPSKIQNQLFYPLVGLSIQLEPK